MARMTRSMKKKENQTNVTDIELKTSGKQASIVHDGAKNPEKGNHGVQAEKKSKKASKKGSKIKQAQKAKAKQGKLPSRKQEKKAKQMTKLLSEKHKDRVDADRGTHRKLTFEPTRILENNNNLCTRHTEEKEGVYVMCTSCEEMFCRFCDLQTLCARNDTHTIQFIHYVASSVLKRVDSLTDEISTAFSDETSQIIEQANEEMKRTDDEIARVNKEYEEKVEKLIGEKRRHGENLNELIEEKRSLKKAKTEALRSAREVMAQGSGAQVVKSQQLLDTMTPESPAADIKTKCASLSKAVTEGGCVSELFSPGKAVSTEYQIPWLGDSHNLVSSGEVKAVCPQSDNGFVWATADGITNDSARMSVCKPAKDQSLVCMTVVGDNYLMIQNSTTKSVIWRLVRTKGGITPTTLFKMELTSQPVDIDATPDRIAVMSLQYLYVYNYSGQLHYKLKKTAKKKSQYAGIHILRDGNIAVAYTDHRTTCVSKLELSTGYEIWTMTSQLSSPYTAICSDKLGLIYAATSTRILIISPEGKRLCNMSVGQGELYDIRDIAISGEQLAVAHSNSGIKLYQLMRC